MFFVRYSTSSEFKYKFWIKRYFKTEALAIKFMEDMKRKDEADGIQREILFTSSDSINQPEEDEPHGKNRKTNY